MERFGWDSGFVLIKGWVWLYSAVGVQRCGKTGLGEEGRGVVPARSLVQGYGRKGWL